MSRQKPDTKEVQRVLKKLSETEIEQIRKENPFRNERDAVIKKLYNRGVKAVIIAEISGLSDIAIVQIAKGNRKYQMILR